MWYHHCSTAMLTIDFYRYPRTMVYLYRKSCLYSKHDSTASYPACVAEGTLIKTISRKIQRALSHTQIDVQIYMRANIYILYMACGDRSDKEFHYQVKQMRLVIDRDTPDISCSSSLAE